MAWRLTLLKVVCIAEVSGQLLICVPNSVWDKKKDRRFLPTSSFKKPIAVSVAAVPFFDREGVVDTPLKVWIGLLALESEKFLDFSGEGEVLKNFHEDGEDELLPYAESLVAVAAEHFTFLSAEEGLTGPGWRRWRAFYSRGSYGYARKVHNGWDSECIAELGSLELEQQDRLL